MKTDWDHAMGRVVEVSRRLLDSKGPLSHGFYTSEQLFLGEYYTLAVIGKAGSPVARQLSRSACTPRGSRRRAPAHSGC